jgi:hypothetical protein
MSGRVLLLVPRGAVPDDAGIPDACSLVVWHVADDIVRAMAGVDTDAVASVLLVSDGLRGDDLSAVVEAVRRCGVPIVEVRSAQWDGFERLELATVCKGVVSGFGVDAAWAVALLHARLTA